MNTAQIAGFKSVLTARRANHEQALIQARRKVVLMEADLAAARAEAATIDGAVQEDAKILADLETLFPTPATPPVTPPANPPVTPPVQPLR